MGCTPKKKHLKYFLFEVQTQQTYQHTASSFQKQVLYPTFVKILLPSDKVLNEKSKFLSEMLMILVSKSV